MSNHPKFDLASSWATGKWHVKEWVYKPGHWAVVNPHGIVVSLKPTKKQALLEMERWRAGVGPGWEAKGSPP